MNYIFIEYDNFKNIQRIINLIDCKRCEIVILKNRQIRFMKSSYKVHYLELSKIKSFLKTIKPTDKLLFLDNTVGFIMPKSIDKIFAKHDQKQISLACQTNGNNELYISQVMGFIPDIVTKNWSDNYIDEADLNTTELETELINNIIFELENGNLNFLNFGKYRVYKINYKVRIMCISPKYVLYLFRSKRPYSLAEIIYKSILSNKSKYLISGCWISENQQMYKFANESERSEDCDFII